MSAGKFAVRWISRRRFIDPAFLHCRWKPAVVPRAYKPATEHQAGTAGPQAGLRRQSVSNLERKLPRTATPRETPARHRPGLKGIGAEGSDFFAIEGTHKGTHLPTTKHPLDVSAAHSAARIIAAQRQSEELPGELGRPPWKTEAKREGGVVGRLTL